MLLSHGIEQCWQFIQNTETEYILRSTVFNGIKPSCEKENPVITTGAGANRQ
jgi:hypothetical protein